MNKKCKDNGKVIGKSGDLLLTRRNERRYAERRLTTALPVHGRNCVPLFRD